MEHHREESLRRNPVNEALGLPTAPEFERALTKLLAQGEQTVLVMLDLDNFLRVNERHGRSEGDRVLIETGRYLMRTLPEGVTLYRYGGDAFAALFAGSEKEDAFLRMEQLRAGYAMPLADGDAVTLSVGIAAAPEDASQYGELVRKAEGAMMRGKLAGRNRVCLAREEKMVVKTTHYTQDQLHRLTKLAGREGTSEAILLREALDGLLKKYDV